MKKTSILAILILCITMVTPNLAFASWWNPFSWFSHPTVKISTSIATSTATSTNSNLSIVKKPKVNLATSTPTKRVLTSSIENKPVTTAPIPPVVTNNPSSLLVAQFLEIPQLITLKHFVPRQRIFQEIHQTFWTATEKI